MAKDGFFIGAGKPEGKKRRHSERPSHPKAKQQQTSHLKQSKRHDIQSESEDGTEDELTEDEEDASEEEQEIEKVEKPKKKKHRPTEMSSKQRPPRVRDDIAKDLVGVRKAKSRDPRFDSLSGRLNQDLFEKSYGFVQDYQQEEKEMLKKKLQKTKNAEEKDHLKRLLTRMNDQERSKVAKRKAQDVKRAWRKQEKEKTAQGKKPYFLKASKQKEMLLREKYDEAKQKSPQYLEKMLEKRRQRNTAKEHRHMPMSKE